MTENLEIKRLRTALEEIWELASYHCDDEADEDDRCPKDMAAHVNGLIRQKCAKALTPNAGVMMPTNQAPDKLRHLSPTWAALVDRWDEVESSFIAEAGRDWCKGLPAPKTYKLMKEIGC